jgi:hypothetical protein
MTPNPTTLKLRWIKQMDKTKKASPLRLRSALASGKASYWFIINHLQHFYCTTQLFAIRHLAPH